MDSRSQFVDFDGQVPRVKTVGLFAEAILSLRGDWGTKEYK